MNVGAARDAWLVTGIPGAGKSTVARLLALGLPRSAHIEGDRLHEWIVGGMVPPGAEPLDEQRRQLDLVVDLQCLLARGYAEAGFVPILDYVIVSRERLARYRRGLRGLGLHLVVLDPGREVALRRDRLRADKTVAGPFVVLEDDMRRELRGLGMWVDSGALTAEETVGEILRQRERARLPRTT